MNVQCQDQQHSQAFRQRKILDTAYTLSDHALPAGNESDEEWKRLVPRALGCSVVTIQCSFGDETYTAFPKPGKVQYYPIIIQGSF